MCYHHSNMTFAKFGAVAAILCVHCVGSFAIAQTFNTGEFLGTVTDSTGGAVPGATVRVIRVDQPLIRVRTGSGVRAPNHGDALRWLCVQDAHIARAAVGRQRESYLKLCPVNPIRMLAAAWGLHLLCVFAATGDHAACCRPPVFHHVVLVDCRNPLKR